MIATNFGIGFNFLDRFFGTIAQSHRPFNWTGYETAKQRYVREEIDEDFDEESEEDSPW